MHKVMLLNEEKKNPICPDCGNYKDPKKKEGTLWVCPECDYSWKRSKQNAKTWPKFYTCNFLEPGLVSYEDVDAGINMLKQEAIMKMLQSFKGKPVVIDHQDVNPKNMNRHAVGYITNVYWNDAAKWAMCDFIITEDEAHSKIQDGYSVSCAYRVTETGPGGEFHAVKYDSEILNGEGEHLALVTNPRYEDCRVVVNGKKARIQEEEENEDPEDEQPEENKTFKKLKGNRDGLLNAQGHTMKFTTVAEYEKIVEEMGYEDIAEFERETGASFARLKGKRWELIGGRVMVNHKAVLKNKHGWELKDTLTSPYKGKTVKGTVTKVIRSSAVDNWSELEVELEDGTKTRIKAENSRRNSGVCQEASCLMSALTGEDYCQKHMKKSNSIKAVIRNKRYDEPFEVGEQIFVYDRQNPKMGKNEEFVHRTSSQKMKVKCVARDGQGSNTGWWCRVKEIVGSKKANSFKAVVRQNAGAIDASVKRKFKQYIMDKIGLKKLQKMSTGDLDRTVLYAADDFCRQEKIRVSKDNAYTLLDVVYGIDEIFR